jgi:DNA-binding NtrC family response regulator
VTNKARILVVDDEANIRRTVAYALEAEGHQVDTAVNGEEALDKIMTATYGLVLLDMQLPGIDGLETLRRVTAQQPEMRAIIITAHGTIQNAVEAMKLGAIDYIQKPFTPQELREAVGRVLDRAGLMGQPIESYEQHLELARHLLNARDRQAAIHQAHQAIALDPARPEAFNLLGVIQELGGDKLTAQKNYRVALDLERTYKIARENLSRSVDHTRHGEGPRLG